jgi:hypothetical protein
MFSVPWQWRQLPNVVISPMARMRPQAGAGSAIAKQELNAVEAASAAAVRLLTVFLIDPHPIRSCSKPQECDVFTLMTLRHMLLC